MWWYPAEAFFVLTLAAGGGGPSDVVGTDSVTFSESATAVLITASATDTGALSEASTTLAIVAATDAIAMSDDGVASSGSSNQVGVDSGTLSETLTLLATSAVTDSAALTEAASVIAADTPTDTVTLSDSAVVAAFLASIADSATLSEQGTGTLFSSGNISDSQPLTLNESATAFIAPAATDSLSITDSGFTLAEMLGTESLVFSEDALAQATFSGVASGTPSLAPRMQSALGAVQETITWDAVAITWDSVDVTLDGSFVGALPVSGARAPSGEASIEAIEGVPSLVEA